MADPMTGATFVRALKFEGLTVKAFKDTWQDHERDKATGKTFGPVHGVVIHHTGALHDADYIWGGSASLPGPLAHAFIDKAGTVWMMSAGRANHAGGGDPDVLNAVIAESYMSRPPTPKFGEGDHGAADGNDVFYGFECENLGDGMDPWPHAQYVAMVRAAAAICRHYGWKEKSVIGHLEWSSKKVDPKGFGMVTFRADVAACLRARPGSWPSQPEAPAPTPVPARSLAQLDKAVRAIETKLGLPHTR